MYTRRPPTPYYQNHHATYSSSRVIEPSSSTTSNRSFNNSTIERATDEELAQSIAESRRPRPPIPPAMISPDIRKNSRYHDSATISRRKSHEPRRRRHHADPGLRRQLSHASAMMDTTLSASVEGLPSHASHTVRSGRTTPSRYSGRSASSALPSRSASPMHWVNREQPRNRVYSTSSEYSTQSTSTISTVPTIPHQSGHHPVRSMTMRTARSAQSLNTVDSWGAVAYPTQSKRTVYSARSTSSLGSEQYRQYSASTAHLIPPVPAIPSEYLEYSGQTLHSARSMPTVHSRHPVPSPNSTTSRGSFRSKHSVRSEPSRPKHDVLPQYTPASRLSEMGYKGEFGLHGALIRPSGRFRLDNPCGRNNVVCYLFHHPDLKFAKVPVTVTKEKHIVVFLNSPDFEIKHDVPVTLKEFVKEFHRFLHTPILEPGSPELCKVETSKPPEVPKNWIKARAKKWLGSRQQSTGRSIHQRINPAFDASRIPQKIDYFSDAKENEPGIYLKGLGRDNYEGGYLITRDSLVFIEPHAY